MVIYVEADSWKNKTNNELADTVYTVSAYVRKNLGENSTIDFYALFEDELISRIKCLV